MSAFPAEISCPCLPNMSLGIAINGAAYSTKAGFSVNVKAGTYRRRKFSSMPPDSGQSETRRLAFHKLNDIWTPCQTARTKLGTLEWASSEPLLTSISLKDTTS